MEASCAAWVALRSVVSRPTWSVVSPSASLRASRCCGVYSITCIIGPIISCMAMGSSIMGCIGCAGCCAASRPAASAANPSIEMRFIVRSPSRLPNDNAAPALLPRCGSGMFRLVAPSIRSALALASLGALARYRPPQASSQSGTDAWRPQAVPFWGVSYSPDIGLLIGAGITHTRYGFRALPPSTRLFAEGEYATEAATYRVDAAGEFRRPLLPAILYVELRASGLELIRFYGTGNETDGSQPDSVYRVGQTQLLVGPRVGLPLAPRLRLTLGPLLKYPHTPGDPGTVLRTTGPYYGTGDFGQVGAQAGLELDTRDFPAAPARGLHLSIAGQWYPALWDVVDAFGNVSAEASTYLSAGDPPSATLALRAGGAVVSGPVPFQELVYVGGGTTVREIGRASCRERG